MSTDIALLPAGFVGTYLLKHVNLDSFSAEPIMAEDGMIPKGTRYHITGTALMIEGNWSEFQSSLAYNSTRMTSVTLTSGSAGTLINLTAAKSNIGGPYCKVNCTQVSGAQVLHVHFDIHDEVSYCDDQPVVSHCWTQRMALDATGRPTRQINGTVSTARRVTTTSDVPAAYNNWNNTVPWADLYRSACLPTLPNYGWRRESQEFAYDPHSTSLIYSVTDKQYLHDLPDGVRVGDMDFTYEKTADNPVMAHCSFVCELEGDMSLRGLPLATTTSTGNRRLIDAAVQLSKTRIAASSGTFKQTIITRMRVTERNMLSGFSIRLEIDADVFTGNNAGTVVAMSTVIGRRFEVTREISRTMDAYGPQVPYAKEDNSATVAFSMVPHYVQNYLLNGQNCAGRTGNMPQATLLANTDDVLFGSVTILVLEDESGLEIINNEFLGAYRTAQQNNNTDGDGYTELISHNVSTTNAKSDTGLIRLTTMYKDKPDIVLQTRKPYVLVSERIEVAKANTAPTKFNRPLETGSFLVSEDWNVSYGKFDPQGNRLFTGIFERTYALRDLGGDPVGDAPTTVNGFVTDGQVRRWQAPNETLLPTISVLATTASQATSTTVFGTTGTVTPERYNVPASVYLA